MQARVKGGGEYQPLVDVHGVPSWPSRPDYGQLVNGRALAREDRDFEAHLGAAPRRHARRCG